MSRTMVLEYAVKVRRTQTINDNDLRGESQALYQLAYTLQNGGDNIDVESIRFKIEETK